MTATRSNGAFRGEQHGFWCRPMPGCDGRGFDSFPVDPDYRDENGNPMWVHVDDEDETGLAGMRT